MDLINHDDIDYIMSPTGNNIWFQNLEEHQIHIKTGDFGNSGTKSIPKTRRFKLRDTLSRILPITIKKAIRGKR